ncbi:MAG: sigma 54-interacting transcriptional regulator, partial [Pseudoflavonifractor sp.]
ISEMPLETQVQLLRVLQEKEIRRVGSDRVTPVDIRIVTATNRNLAQLVREKSFREDLFYRLNVLSIELPPLRIRHNDIKILGFAAFDRFAGSTCAAWHDTVGALLDELSDYAWPGNAREINNVMERTHVLLSQGESPERVSAYVRQLIHHSECLADPVPEPGDTAGDLEDWERERIIEALKKNHLVLADTARALGVSRTTLWRKIKKNGIKL